MKNRDKITLFIFFFLIILIIGIFIFNMYKNRKLENINRKVEYIFNKFTYNTIYTSGNEMFFQAIELFNNENVFEYEVDSNSKIKYYVLNNDNKYKKINNFIIVSNTFASSEVKKFMELKHIIKYENNYYIENYNDNINSNYIGSITDIKSYDNKFVYFESVNYYCNYYKYVGYLEEEPNCNYTTTKTNFTIVLENNNLRLNSIEEIKSIVK